MSKASSRVLSSTLRERALRLGLEESTVEGRGDPHATIENMELATSLRSSQ
ncbi:MAG: hypothetical protein ACD_62C00693G0005 [uncultured bacterium]|nr:MAG: hypothetical protein ACD_62C00693G0005 [uncultured bacterium]